MTAAITIMTVLLDTLAMALFGVMALLAVLIVWAAVELRRLPACNWRQRDREN